MRSSIPTLTLHVHANILMGLIFAVRNQPHIWQKCPARRCTIIFLFYIDSGWCIEELVFPLILCIALTPGRPRVKATCPCVEDIYLQLKSLTTVPDPGGPEIEADPPADEPVGKFVYFCNLQCFVVERSIAFGNSQEYKR